MAFNYQRLRDKFKKGLLKSGFKPEDIEWLSSEKKWMAKTSKKRK